MNAKPAIAAIGTGQIGPKSQGLIGGSDVFRKAGLLLPGVHPCASEHFREFFGRAGVNGKTDNEAAQRKIMQADFTSQEKEPIIEVARKEFLCPSMYSGYKMAYAAIARSDELAAGTGIRKSSPALSVGDEKLFLDRLFVAIKEVLASRFTSDARLFDRLMGLGGESNGVMLMPYYGTMVRGEQYAAAFPILLSVAYAGGTAKASIFSLGEDAPAQWHNYATSGSSFGFRASLFNAISSGNAEFSTLQLLRRKIARMRGIDASSMGLVDFESALDSTLRPDVRAIYSSPHQDNNVTYQSYLLQENIAKVAKALPVIFGQIGPFYAEFVMNHGESGMPVQLAKLKVNATEPGFSGLSPDILAMGGISEAIGTGKKTVENVHSARHTPTSGDLQFNETHSGYLLHIKSDGRLPMQDWTLSHLYNAGAIYLESHDLQGMCLGFHLGGYLRELGIPLLISDISPDFKKDGKYIVQADEFGLRGPLGAILKA